MESREPKSIKGCLRYDYYVSLNISVLYILQNKYLNILLRGYRSPIITPDLIFRQTAIWH